MGEVVAPHDLILEVRRGEAAEISDAEVGSIIGVWPAAALDTCGLRANPRSNRLLIPSLFRSAASAVLPERVSVGPKAGMVCDWPRIPQSEIYIFNPCKFAPGGHA